MNMSKEKLMRLAGRALKRTESYQWNRGLDVPDEENYKIDYLLVKGSKASPEDVIAYASFEDDMVRFHPLRENDQPFAHYGECFTYDSDLFEPLEQGYSLACMSPEAHACAWYEIEDLQGGIEHQAGMQSYLHYCKQHGVTRVQLARLADYDGMDVMKLHSGLRRGRGPLLSPAPLLWRGNPFLGLHFGRVPLCHAGVYHLPRHDGGTIHLGVAALGNAGAKGDKV